MIRSELIQTIADDNPHLFQRDVERIVNAIFDEITNAMAHGGIFKAHSRESIGPWNRVRFAAHARAAWRGQPLL